MAPPAIARIEAGLKGIVHGSPQTFPDPGPSTPPDEDPEPVEEPKMELFPKFPAEIQQLIWAEALAKPACHTFKFVQRKFGFHTGRNSHLNGFAWDLAPIPSLYDPSSYRHWKSMLWCSYYKQPMDVADKKPKKKRNMGAMQPKVAEPILEGPELEKLYLEKANLHNELKSAVVKSHEAFSKLAIASFQAGFRNSMVQLETVEMDTPDGVRDAAAIDVATDLVILEFNRGENARPSAWFEHTGTGNMDIRVIRERTVQLRRVAVHWKKTHANSDKRGPFQCWCANPATLNCTSYKACPVEQACFLDCFPSLEEFYYVIEVMTVNGRDVRWWLDVFRDYARSNDFKVPTSEDNKSPQFKLAHFYDEKYEYLQLCPHKYLDFLPELKKPRNFYVRELEFNEKPRDCLLKVMDIYKGKTGKDDYHTKLEQRRKTKFGILMAYKLNK